MKSLTGLCESVTAKQVSELTAFIRILTNVPLPF